MSWPRLNVAYVESNSWSPDMMRASISLKTQHFCPHLHGAILNLSLTKKKGYSGSMGPVLFIDTDTVGFLTTSVGVHNPQAKQA